MSAPMKLAGARGVDGQVELTWTDGSRERLHNLWLRDNCSAGRGYVNDIEHRTHRLVELPAQPELAALSWSPDELRLEWSGGHVSAFESSWLAAYTPRRARPEYRPALGTWDAAGLAELPSWELAELAEGDTMLTLLERLLQCGIVLVRETPHEPGFMRSFFSDLCPIYDTIFGPFWALRPPPDGDVLTQKLEHSLFPLHTDLTYAVSASTHQAFHCIELDERGGESIFVDGFRVAEDLRRDAPEHFELLSTHDTPYRYLDDNFDVRTRRRIISTSARGELESIAFCDRQMLPLDLADELIMPYYAAYRDWVARVHEPRYIVELKLAAGDLVLFDNARVMHGRRALSTTHHARRHLEGCYLQPHGLESRWRSLHRAKQLGGELPRDAWPSIASPVGHRGG